ncbi:variant SH3 domain-containing protein [Sarocladium implicatum]|nr:variant SH3 domain-containing protein [Sarocladium implicatum]
MTVRHRHVHRDWSDTARQWGDQMRDDVKSWGDNAKDWADKANPFSDSNGSRQRDGDNDEGGNEDEERPTRKAGNDHRHSDEGEQGSTGSDSGSEAEARSQQDDHGADTSKDNVGHKTVYKTLSQTFDGDIADYSTLVKAQSKPTAASSKGDDDDEDDEKVTKAPKAKATTTSSSSDEEETSAADKKKALDSASDTEMPTAIKKPTETSSIDDILAKETGAPSATAPLHTVNAADITTSVRGVSSTESSDASKGDSDGGTSAGTKAGIAFGVLGGLLVIGLIVFFIFNRRKKQSRERLEDDDEKLHDPPGDAAFAGGVAAQSNPKAPRLSLRPVTQFFPGFAGDKRASKSAAMSLGPAAAASQWDRPSTSQSSHAANPFGNHAERAPSPIAEEKNMYNKPMPPRPAGDGMPASDPFTANGPAVAAGAAAVGATTLARKTSMRKDGPKKVDLTLSRGLGAAPPSPSGTEFSDSPETPGAGPTPSSGAAAIAAAGGPANTGVHRVQLDFAATLEDEMNLTAGQLVRLLHEYDDGWALCIRLDRSQQGVVPRTCLSTRPVKPRLPPGAQRPGPPVNPQGDSRGPPRGPGHPRGPPMGPGPQGRPRGPSGAGPAPPGGLPKGSYGPGPNARGQSPMGRPMPRPNGPGNGPRPQSPSPRMQAPPGGRPESPGPRMQGPPGGRPQSPGPRMQGPPGGRPQSPSGMNRRMSPPGPSQLTNHERTPSAPINRKPVPGQAL